MSRKNTRFLGLSKLAIGLSCLIGLVVGVPLVSLNAPLWAYYLASLALIAPLLAWELPRAAAEEDRERGRS